MNKKGQGLSITTVVVAILAVLVLVVLFYVFTSKVGPFSKTAMSCPSGPCVTEAVCTSRGGQPLPGKYLDTVTTPDNPFECGGLSSSGTVCCSAGA